VAGGNIVTDQDKHLARDVAGLLVWGAFCFWLMFVAIPAAITWVMAR